jgi:hypothetical protein
MARQRKLKRNSSCPPSPSAIISPIPVKDKRKFHVFTSSLNPIRDTQYAIVDPEDYDWLMQYKWHANSGRGKFYAVNSRMQKMHRLIMLNSNPKYEIRNTKMFVDHINGNGLDNRKANLRLATYAQNNWNSRHGMGQGRSRYKGVKWHKRIRKWAAVISVNGRREHLGYYRDEKEATRAFDRAAKKYHGEFAVLNFPNKS